MRSLRVRFDSLGPARRRGSCVLALGAALALLAAPAAAWAQDSVREGDRVRVTVPNARRVPVRFEGTLESVHPDTIGIASPAGLRLYARPTVLRWEKGEMRRPAFQNMLLGAIAGAFVAGAITFYAHPGDDQAGLRAMFATAPGALAGLAIGAVIPGLVWRDAEPPR